mmetsp:Transcript_8058/g.17930  ORF Transcript_8058/g.17930 Transcript_8058/m.17930 type:complete len:109 (-) Transcript_8058:27-353(-)
MCSNCTPSFPSSATGWQNNANCGPKKILNYRAAKLESIGVLWMVVKTRWDSMFRLLQNYKEIHGNTKVPKYYKPNPKFGRWVHFQRAKRVKKQLNGYRGLCLASIGFE